MLPDRRATQATEADEEVHPGPERWNVLETSLRRGIDVVALVGGLVSVGLLIWQLDLEPISACLIAFFGWTMLRKLTLDALLRRAGPPPAASAPV